MKPFAGTFCRAQTLKLGGVNLYYIIFINYIVNDSASSNTNVMKETHQNNIIIHKFMKIIMNDHRYIGCARVNTKTYGLYILPDGASTNFFIQTLFYDQYYMYKCITIS